MSFVNWVILIALASLFFGLCYLLNWLRGKFLVVDTYWKNGTIWAFLAVILVHMGIWWLWPEFWHEWWSRSGFLFFQILVGVGFYLRLGLKDKKFLRHLGLILIALGVVGIGWNIYSALRVHRSATEVMSPAELKNLPKQNWDGEQKVTRFWKNHLPEESALAILRIVRRQSGFNQFGENGKPYRNPANPSKVGVMQIDDSIWSERARELEYNLYEMDGNLRFALWLYKEQGFAPWLGNSQTTLDSAKQVSSAIGDAFSSKPKADERQAKRIRDFLDRNRTDNPEVLTRLIRTIEMWPTMIGPRSRVVNIPATGWSEKIAIGKTPMRIRPSEDMVVSDDHGREYPISVINPNWNFPPTEWVRYRSVSGKPAIVLVSP